MAAAGKIHLEEGLSANSNVAKQFFNGTKCQFEGYVPFFSKGEYLFKETKALVDDLYYTINSIEDIVRMQLNLNSVEFTNL